MQEEASPAQWRPLLKLRTDDLFEAASSRKEGKQVSVLKMKQRANVAKCD
jgi:hypothetical protein